MRRPRRRRVGRVGVLVAKAAVLVTAAGGVLYASPAVPCACSTPSYAAPFSTVSPLVTGTTTVGSVLSVTTGTWAGDTSSGFTYQWTDDNGNIAGATSATYTILIAENGLHVGATVTATGVGGANSANSNTVGAITNPSPGPTTAHEWVSAAGNDSTCARNASAVSYATALAASPTNVCATGPKGYTIASLGDNVLAQGAPFTVSTQWFFTKTLTKTVTSGTCNYNYGGSSDFSNCVTIEPAVGQSLVFNCSTGGCTGSGTAQGVQIKICVSGLSIQNATVTETDWTDTYGGLNKQSSNNAMAVGSGDNTCGTVLAPHDDYFANITFGGQVGIVGGANNVWIVNSVAASTKNLPWQFAGTGNNGAFAAVHDSGVVGTTFRGYNFVANNGRHMECVHADISENHETWAGDQFDQCPIESLFFETESGSQHDNLIENNYFDSGSGGGPFKFSCRQPGCTESNNTIRFNSLRGAMQFACEASSGSCNIDNNVFYGNLNIGCGTVTTNGASIVGTGLVDLGYNVLSVAKTGWCTANTSAYSATVTYVSPGSPNYDLGLSGAQTATGFVTVGSGLTLPATNLQGAARSFPTDAGGN